MVAIDDQDGTIEESEPDSWIAMHADPADAPEDWSGSADVNDEDLPGVASPMFIGWQTQLKVINDPE